MTDGTLRIRVVIGFPPSINTTLKQYKTVMGHLIGNDGIMQAIGNDHLIWLRKYDRDCDYDIAVLMHEIIHLIMYRFRVEGKTGVNAVTEEQFAFRCDAMFQRIMKELG